MESYRDDAVLLGAFERHAPRLYQLEHLSFDLLVVGLLHQFPHLLHELRRCDFLMNRCSAVLHHGLHYLEGWDFERQVGGAFMLHKLVSYQVRLDLQSVKLDVRVLVVEFLLDGGYGVLWRSVSPANRVTDGHRRHPVGLQQELRRRLLHQTIESPRRSKHDGGSW